MKRKFLEEMGLAKEQIDRILDENSQDIGAAKGSVETEKGKLAAAERELEALRQQLTERDRQLETLKNETGDAASLKAKIAELEAENAAKEAARESERRESAILTAIKLELAGKVHDSDLAAGLLDKTRIELDDSGNIKNGLKEQIEDLRKGKSFLFVPEQKTVFKGITPAEGQKPAQGDGGDVAFAKSLAQSVKQSEGSGGAGHYFKD